MPLQALYIKEDILTRLKKEQNMSELVNRLLDNYFSSDVEKTIDKEVLRKEIANADERKKTALRRLQEVEETEKQKEEELDHKLKWTKIQAEYFTNEKWQEEYVALKKLNSGYLLADYLREKLKTWKN